MRTKTKTLTGTMLTALLLCLATFAHAQESAANPEADTLAVRVSEYLADAPQEKIYLHTDKPYYMAGDTVWFRAHLVDAATNIPSTSTLYPEGRSRYIYVELHDNAADTLVERAMIKRDSMGVFANAFTLPRELSGGRYTLAAYTRYMMNFPKERFAYREIEVVENDDNGNDNLNANLNHDKVKRNHDFHPSSLTSQFEPALSVAALPEGGNLIVGHRQKLAYKAIGGDGYGRDVNARIVCKETENVVAEGTSQHLGMGYLYFTPQRGEHYRLEAYSDNGQSCYADVPEALERGVSLSVTQRKDVLSVTPIVEGVDASGLSLLIYGSGNVMHKENIGDGNGNENGNENGDENGDENENADNAGSILIDTSSFRPGVVNIAIVSEAAKTVLAERLAFIYPNKTVAVRVEE